MPLTGLHHATLVTAGARVNLAFCRDLLGLRRSKRAMNFDGPDVAHLC